MQSSPRVLSKQYNASIGANGWTIWAFLITGLVILPILTVVFLAFFPTENIWPHMLNTTLPRYFKTTVSLMIVVGIAAASVGTITAYIIARYRFWGSRLLEWALLMPLAIPAYVGAYALVDLLEYAGPVQTALRGAFGWQNARDYWFPEIRSFTAACLVLSCALYPYVYLLARAAFRDQSAAADDVAKSLGRGAIARFWRIGLPLARPSIAAGTAIVMMETVNDFGTVDYFAVQTLTTGIFSVWLQSGNVGGAAQLACVILAVIIVLVSLEKSARRKMQFFNLSTRHRGIEKSKLQGRRAVGAFAVCFIPVLLGFVIPTAVLGWHALMHLDEWINPALISALLNTLWVASIAALITVFAGIVMVYGVRLARSDIPKRVLPVTSIGYAAPGAVLGIGLLIPLAWFDNRVADGIWSLTGIDIGLILTGTSAAIIYAYCVRFFAIAQGAGDAAMGRVSPNLANAARSLGRNRVQTLRDVYFPLMRGSIGSALLLVFVDCVKELPATLLLRPFNYNTLATLVHEQASLENLSQAAPASLYIISVGLLAVLFLARTNR